MIGVNGSCFDVCSRVVSADSVPAVEVAIAEADDLWCSSFGPTCSFFTPPCAPPGVARCDDGQCI